MEFRLKNLTGRADDPRAESGGGEIRIVAEGSSSPRPLALPAALTRGPAWRGLPRSSGQDLGRGAGQAVVLCQEMGLVIVRKGEDQRWKAASRSTVELRLAEEVHFKAGPRPPSSGVGIAILLGSRSRRCSSMPRTRLQGGGGRRSSTQASAGQRRSSMHHRLPGSDDPGQVKEAVKRAPDRDQARSRGAHRPDLSGH